MTIHVVFKDYDDEIDFADYFPTIEMVEYANENMGHRTLYLIPPKKAIKKRLYRVSVYRQDEKGKLIL